MAKAGGLGFGAGGGGVLSFQQTAQNSPSSISFK
jgi:hypothetical protein